MGASCREYDNLAWLYNRYWGREYPAAVLGILEKLLFPFLPSGAGILDLCCGAGHLTDRLCERNFTIVGIDGSPSMLAYARENAPGAFLTAADARRFSLRRRFDAVISTFETMNHILQEGELSLVFGNVLAVLAEGGAFLFDLLMEEAYRQEWAKSSAIVEDDVVCITRGGYDPATASAHADVTAFVKNPGAWRRSDVTVHERWYPVELIVTLLRNEGFAEVHEYDAGSLGMTGSLAVGRKFLLAKR